MSISRKTMITTLLALGFVAGSVTSANAGAEYSSGFYHFPGDHSEKNGYGPSDNHDDRCVEIDSYIEHGSNGYGRSTMFWTTTRSVGMQGAPYGYHCEWQGDGGSGWFEGWGSGADAAMVQMWKTDVFVTVVLKKQGSGPYEECMAHSQYRSGIKRGYWSWAWNASDINSCGGPGYYYTWAEIQAYDPAIWPQSDGWSPPVHHNSPVHWLPTSAEAPMRCGDFCTNECPNCSTLQSPLEPVSGYSWSAQHAVENEQHWPIRYVNAERKYLEAK